MVLEKDGEYSGNIVNKYIINIEVHFVSYLCVMDICTMFNVTLRFGSGTLMRVVYQPKHIAVFQQIEEMSGCI